MENEFKAKVEPYIIMLEHPITGERMGICAAMFLNINGDMKRKTKLKI